MEGNEYLAIVKQEDWWSWYYPARMMQILAEIHGDLNFFCEISYLVAVNIQP